MARCGSGQVLAPDRMDETGRYALIPGLAGLGAEYRDQRQCARVAGRRWDGLRVRAGMAGLVTAVLGSCGCAAAGSSPAPVAQGRTTPASSAAPATSAAAPSAAGTSAAGTSAAGTSAAGTSAAAPSAASPSAAAPLARPVSASEAAGAVPSAHAAAASAARGTSQLVTVTAASRGATQAELTAYRRVDGRWRRVFGPWVAWIGRNGMAPPGAKREGDGRTPSGTFGFGFFFGVDPDPGVRFPYRRIDGVRLLGR